MRLYPAIDLQNGQCVRLVQGDLAQSTIYNASPPAQAKQFAEQGFGYLHLVDLNGAVAGQSKNATAIEAILASINIPVQLGGGIREMAHIAHWLEAGIARVILGTAAFTKPDLLAEACQTYAGKICVALDERDGKIATTGWTTETDTTAEEALKRFADMGVAAVIYTDITRDGLLQGVNLARTEALAQATHIPVIASGGVRDLADIQALKNSTANIEGVICGRALYEGTLDIAEALQLARET